MNESFSVGDHIEVSENYHWAKNAIGEIIQPPIQIVEMFDGWKDSFREVKSLNGVIYFYWVRFNKPQFDADGDGPYQEAAIQSDFLHLLNKKE